MATCPALPSVRPVLELRPTAAGIGIHTHKKITLHCSGSGFPRPELEWSPSEGFKQNSTYTDHYTVATELVAENALPSMSGMYKCHLRIYDSKGGISEEEKIPMVQTSLLVYGKEVMPLVSHSTTADLCRF